MAVNETGAVFKALTFDGESSRDYGVYITGQAVYNAPERAVEMLTIPGRNGAFARDEGRFENIEVTYPAGMFADGQEDFAKAISDFRNMLCSRKGYCRLTDEYNPDEYRLAVYKSGLEVDPVLQKSGEFNITFECKPQRYLMSGERVFHVGDWNDTDIETGDIVTVDNTTGSNGLKSLTVNIEPKQDGTPSLDDTLYKAPYLFHATPNLNHNYNSVLSTLVGGSVAWNQLTKELNSSNWSQASGATLTFQNGEAICTNLPSTWGGMQTNENVPMTSGHKYLVTLTGRVVDSGTSATIGTGVFGTALNLATFTSTTKTTASAIVTATSSTNQHMNVANRNGSASFAIALVQVFDLTQMFGTAIADRAYTLESGTAGAGIAWLRSYGFFTKPYYAYNTGTMQSVKVSKYKSVGFNQWDEEVELGTINMSTGADASSTTQLRTKNYVHVLPNTTYYFKCLKWSNAACYDGDKNFIGAVPYRYSSTPGEYYLDVPANCYYIRFYLQASYGTTYNHDICINLHYDGSRDGEYEQYNAHEYAVEDVELRGTYKYDSVHDTIYADGDVYPADGQVTRKYASLSPTSCISGYVRQNGDYLGRIANNGKAVDNYNMPNIMSDKGLSILGANYQYTGEGSSLAINANNGDVLIVIAGVTTKADLDTWLATNTPTIVYEIATPTTESADPYNTPMVCDNWGTEEWVDTRTVPMPVGGYYRYGEFYDISSTDELNTHVSPNLCDESKLLDGYAYRQGDGTLMESSTKVAVPKLRLYGKDKIAISFDKTVQNTRVNWIVFNENGQKLYWDSQNTADSSWRISDDRVGKVLSFNYNVYPTAYAVGFYFDAADITVVGTISNVMMTFTNTVTDFIAYGDDYETALGETVYGCKADIIAGTGDKTFSSLDLGSLTWTLDVNEDGAKIYGATVSDIKPTQYWIGSRSGFYCDGLPLVLYDVDPTPDPDKFSDLHIGRYNTKVYVRDDNSADADELKRNVTGLTLVYPLNTPAVLTFTAEDIDLAETVNYIWNDEGTVTVEYGTDPYMIVNPTLFESSPLLSVKGYGTIGFNDRSIVVKNETLGRYTLVENKISNITGDFVLDSTNVANNGDDIWATTSVNLQFEGDDSITHIGAVTITTTPTSGEASIYRNTPRFTAIIDNITSNFTKGTTSTKTYNAAFSISYVKNNTSKTLTLSMSVTVKYTSSTDTINVSCVYTLGNNDFLYTGNHTYKANLIYVMSTKTMLGDPTYIDCDLGEAYKIEGGEYIPLNRYIDLGSELPGLAPGINEFQLSNTFTSVKLLPRWWTV